MRKGILIIVLLLSLSLLKPAESVSINDRFPALREGAYFIYNMTKGSFVNISIASVSIRTWDWRYEILEVDNETWTVKIMVNHTEYVNGTPTSSGGYITLVNCKNLNYFEVFFAVDNLYNALAQMLSMYVWGNESYYKIEKINYTYNGVNYKAYNGSYYNPEGYYGYFIVSVDYGIVFEKAQYVIEKNTTLSTAGLKEMSVLRLKSTNLFSKNKPTNLALMIFLVILVIVAIVVFYPLRKIRR